ncbi:hypothetical protein T440DRAFT_410253, partial [Plenodomus tracheiphilus IPT5]
LTQVLAPIYLPTETLRAGIVETQAYRLDRNVMKIMIFMVKQPARKVITTVCDKGPRWMPCHAKSLCISTIDQQSIP